MRFHKPKTRLENKDYGAYGLYFVTICCENRFPHFGEVREDGVMVLSDKGIIARDKWLENERRYSYVRLGAYVIMPDHMHALIEIDPGIKDIDEESKNKFGPLPQGLSRVIRGYKSGVKKWMNDERKFFYWQNKYHCEMVFSNHRKAQIEKYIIENPKRWLDKPHE